ncbi:hypothetical protein BD560DRAFT_398860 [Blakeslea trispora]|nr:hypothetical protein BD560DRAFT_398860 [Blakeslea trispora]
MAERFGLFHTMAITPRNFPSISLFDVEGNELDINTLTLRYHLILITIKSTVCPACPELLKLLNMYGLDANTNSYLDPFTHQEHSVDPIQKKFFRLLLKYDTYFIILCPGTNSEVREVQHRTPFLDYPFVSTEGGANTLVKALKVQLSEEEFMPAILEVSPRTLSVNSIYIGRGPGQYFHQHLLKHLAELRFRQESLGISAIRRANETIQLLKRRQVRCQEGKLVVARISLSTPLSSKTSLEAQAEVSHKSFFDQLPPELVELILFSFDIPDLVKSSGACRLFYRAACNVAVLQLRAQMTLLASAMPQLDGEMIESALDIQNIDVDRWSDAHPEGAPFDYLSSLVSNLSNTLSQIDRWTKHWSPRRTRLR